MLLHHTKLLYLHSCLWAMISVIKHCTEYCIGLISFKGLKPALAAAVLIDIHQFLTIKCDMVLNGFSMLL